MLIGAHVSAVKSLLDAPSEAQKLKCEVFQIFTRPPYGGPPLWRVSEGHPGTGPKLPETIGKEFRKACKTAKQREFYIHAPYFVQLASTNNRTYYGSISALRRELEVGGLIGARYVMTHIGSAKEVTESQALKLVIGGLVKVFEKPVSGSCELLLEMSAGAGSVIGDTFEELATIMKGVRKVCRIQLGICLDTQHAFASGYDLRSKKTVDATLKQFDKIIGLEHLRLIHLNDSKPEFNSHVDRHEHIGKGNIGLEGFEALLTHPALQHINLILETPHDEFLKDDIALLKKLRKKI